MNEMNDWVKERYRQGFVEDFRLSKGLEMRSQIVKIDWCEFFFLNGCWINRG